MTLRKQTFGLVNIDKILGLLKSYTFELTLMKIYFFSELSQAYPSEAILIRAVQSGMTSLPSNNSNPFGISTTNLADMRMTLMSKIRDCIDRDERRAQLELMDDLNKMTDSQPELMETLLVCFILFLFLKNMF